MNIKAILFAGLLIAATGCKKEPPPQPTPTPPTTVPIEWIGQCPQPTSPSGVPIFYISIGNPETKGFCLVYTDRSTPVASNGKINYGYCSGDEPCFFPAGSYSSAEVNSRVTQYGYAILVEQGTSLAVVN